MASSPSTSPVRAAYPSSKSRSMPHSVAAQVEATSTSTDRALVSPRPVGLHHGALRRQRSLRRHLPLRPLRQSNPFHYRDPQPLPIRGARHGLHIRTHLHASPMVRPRHRSISHQRSPGGANPRALARYASNDPLNMTDPAGMWPWDDYCVRGINCDEDTPGLITAWGQDHPEAAQHVRNVAGGVLEVNPITAFLPLDLEGHGVDTCSGWYTVGQGFQSVVNVYGGYLLVRSAGTWVATSTSWGRALVARIFGGSRCGARDNRREQQGWRTGGGSAERPRWNRARNDRTGQHWPRKCPSPCRRSGCRDSGSESLRFARVRRRMRGIRRSGHTTDYVERLTQPATRQPLTGDQWISRWTARRSP